MLYTSESLLPSPNTMDLSLPGAACVSVCVRVFGGGRRGRQTVCLHARCVCMCRTLCSRLKDACKYMELEQQPRFLIFLREVFASVFVLSSRFHTLSRAVSSFNRSGKGLGTRVVVFCFLVRTTICRRLLVVFADASCVVRQHRSFFQRVKMRFGACSNSQR